MAKRRLDAGLSLFIVVLIAVFGLVYSYQLYGGEGKFMVEVKTPTNEKPDAHCYLTKDGNPVETQAVDTVTGGKTGCEFVAPSGIYDLVIKCDQSTQRQERKDIEILPPAFGGTQTVCWGTFYSSNYCQHGKEIEIGCTSEDCDTVVGEACRGTEVWSICRNGILKDYKRTCDYACETGVLEKEGLDVVRATANCDTTTRPVDEFGNFCVDGACQQSLICDTCDNCAGCMERSEERCTGIGTSCSGGIETEGTCTYDFQCGIGGSVGGNFCDGGNVVKSVLSKDCVNGECVSNYDTTLVKDCGSYGCVDGVCKARPIAEPECSIDAECGKAGLIGTSYCSDGDVYRDWSEPYCLSGECKDSVIPKKIRSCEVKCELGQCIGVGVDEPLPKPEEKPEAEPMDLSFLYLLLPAFAVFFYMVMKK